jgi:hypothetical protein
MKSRFRVKFETKEGNKKKFNFLRKVGGGEHFYTFSHWKCERRRYLSLIYAHEVGDRSFQMRKGVETEKFFENFILSIVFQWRKSIWKVYEKKEKSV